ncbi:MAG: BMP family ABC transporter substrate-binding protein [Dethiosulfatibacter sp.]|nr:BMP family ABC transporter substrate-binding protein [Dethiosulfatibacter sp.]
MRHKRIAIILIIIMLFTTATTFVGAQDGQEEMLISQRFSDMPDDWSTEALEKAVENGLITGSDGLIKPKDPLTRAQMATIINRAFGATNKASISNYTDVPGGAWYYEEMAKAVQMKTFLGDGNRLYPDNPITRQEAFLVLARALKIEVSSVEPSGFTDLDDIASWAKGEIYALINQGYIQGSGGKINPKQTITRAEFAQLMHNLIKTYIKEPGEYTDLPEGNVMVLVPGVAFVNTTVNGHLILGEGVDEDTVNLVNSLLTGRWIIRMQEASMKTVIGFVTDWSGLGHDNLNDMILAGLTKAKTDLNFDVRVIESDGDGDYLKDLTELAEEELELIISYGYTMADATKTAAENYPDQRFVIIDDNSIEMDNVMSISFKEHEGSFIVGVIAGLTTDTNVVGFIGGVQFALIDKFLYGYMAGVKSVNSDAEILFDYANSFTESDIGVTLATAQNNQNADVIFHAAGGTGLGVIEAAGESDFWAIGVDSDQSSLDPNHVLCSMVKRFDYAVYEAIKHVLEGSFVGGNMEYGLEEDAVGYMDGAGNVSNLIAESAELYKSKIISGEIIVPYDETTYDEFIQ